MEPTSGVFVTSSSTDRWEPDPEVPGTLMHELVRADGLYAGLTRIDHAEGPITWTPEQREVAVVLEGSVRIDVDGEVLDLGPGDLFSLPPGHETTWHVTTPFREMWALAD